MSTLDLYPDEGAGRLRELAPISEPNVGAWDGFIRGTAMHTMRGLAKVGRSIDLLGSIGPIVQDAFTGGTEAQDRYFREHDELYGGAVDYWTPNPKEVGAAAEVAGGLVSALPVLFASPSLLVGSTLLGTGEDLVQKGVSAGTATAVGAAQAAGLGLGIRVPIFGRNLMQRVLLGGIGFNVAQGALMRGAGQVMLAGTPAAEDYRMLDPSGIALDILLGAAFGAYAHLSPSARAESAEAWATLDKWAAGLRGSDIEALAALRQTQHLNVDSLPGKPAEPADVGKHVARVRQAIEQLARDEPVNVADLPPARFEPSPARVAEAEANVQALDRIANEVAIAEGIDVWHGSPHVFTEFDASKIGAGEGVQAYGHGIYIAESRGVAETYKAAGDSLTFQPIETARPGTVEVDLQDVINKKIAAGMRLDEIKRQAWEWLQESPYSNDRAALETGLQFINQLESAKGNLYRVRMPADMPERMLDWDKPLTKQTPAVRGAIEPLVQALEADQRTILGAFSEHDIVREFAAQRRTMTGEDLYNRLGTVLGKDDAGISAALEQAGIPGIRYLDAGSRGAGEGTRNMVIFPGQEKQLTILDRNGEPVRLAQPKPEAPATSEAGLPPPREVRPVGAGAEGPQFTPKPGRTYAEGLPPEQVAIERAAFDMLDAQQERLIGQYRELFGNVIDPDNVKRLFPAYQVDQSLAAAVHEPSSELAKVLFTRYLRDHPGEPVLFTAGGGGSGKSETLRSANPSQFGVVLDTTLSSFPKAVKKIDEALSNGGTVHILYTNRPLNAAFEHAMGRSRVVPLVNIAGAHVGAADTIVRLAEHYQDNPKVNVTIVNNHDGPGGMTPGRLTDIPRYDYEAITRQLHEQAIEAFSVGRIPAERYAALVQGSIETGIGPVKAALQGPDMAGPGPDRGLERAGGDQARAGPAEAPRVEPPDPVRAAAEDVAAAHGDMPLRVGTDAEGNQITTTVRQYLADADAMVRDAEQDADLFHLAARCLLGGG